MWCGHYNAGMSIFVRHDPSRYWLVETHREGGRTVQRRLKYLGQEPPSSEEVERLKAEYADRVPPPKKRGRPRKGDK